MELRLVTKVISETSSQTIDKICESTPSFIDFAFNSTKFFDEEVTDLVRKKSIMQRHLKKIGDFNFCGFVLEFH